MAKLTRHYSLRKQRSTPSDAAAANDKFPLIGPWYLQPAAIASLCLLALFAATFALLEGPLSAPALASATLLPQNHTAVALAAVLAAAGEAVNAAQAAAASAASARSSAEEAVRLAKMSAEAAGQHELARQMQQPPPPPGTCKLALVVQGTPAGGLPKHGGPERNYVGLFAFGQPAPAWALPEGLSREAFDFSGYIRVFSTWHTAKPEELELIEAYRAAGFHIVLSNLTELLATKGPDGSLLTAGGLMPTTDTGRSTINLQMQTAHAGVLRAQELGATHAVKMRTDILIRDFSAFLGTLEGGGTGCAPRLTFVHWLDYAQVWAGQHFAPSPHDSLYAGPLGLVLSYTGAAFQPAKHLVSGELYQMDEYCYSQGITRLDFCRSADFLAPRLAKNVILWMHPASTGPYRDMQDDPTLPHAPCRDCVSCTLPCAAAQADICPPYAFGSRDGPCPPTCS